MSVGDDRAELVERVNALTEQLATLEGEYHEATLEAAEYANRWRESSALLTADADMQVSVATFKSWIDPTTGERLYAQVPDACKEVATAQREPAAGWEKVGVFWWLLLGYTPRLTLRISDQGGDYTFELSDGIRLVQSGTAPDRRAAMLAAEDAAAERERARCEALGYRMVRE